ncbi:MAG: cyanophycinase, partial [Opitutales bacterium]|nr:cyanophycinase [Opitutales bacterium]
IFSISSLSVFAKTTVGPENGTLMIVGGGSYRDSGILEKFIELAGGSDAKFVFVPTASGRDFTSNEPELPTSWRALELKNVAILHTQDRAIADSDEFVEPLRDADAVWFSGGRQWRLVDAYKDTKAEKMFRKVLDRGGIIGGSSAGATIQGSYLARGDSSGNQIMMGDHEVGFGYLKDVAIDQHVLARNRHFDLFTILKKRPELLGIGIDESTAVIVNGDTFEVFGKSFVLIYDGTFWSREGWDQKELPEADSLFYFLRPGDRYDLKTRRVIQ